MRSLNYNLDLQSSSFTLGNASKLSLRSLNHDLATILDEHTLLGLAHLLTGQIVNGATLLLSILDVADTCGL